MYISHVHYVRLVQDIEDGDGEQNLEFVLTVKR
jgi:hypothetical protein